MRATTGRHPAAPRHHSRSPARRGCVCPSALALLLVRIIETRTGTTWPRTRWELQRLHAGTFTGPTGTFQQVTTLTKAQRDLLAKLGIPHPSRSSTFNPHPLTSRNATA